MSASPLHAVSDQPEPDPTLDRSLLEHMLGYIGVVRDALRMQQWDVILHTDPLEDDDAWAETWQSHNHATTNIRLCARFFDQTPDRIRNTIVHELIHVQHRDITILWEACTINNSGIPVNESQSWNHDFSMQMERFVSWITQRIEESIPTYDPDADYPALTGCVIDDGVRPR